MFTSNLRPYIQNKSPVYRRSPSCESHLKGRMWWMKNRLQARKEQRKIIVLMWSFSTMCEGIFGLFCRTVSTNQAEKKQLRYWYRFKVSRAHLGEESFGHVNDKNTHKQAVWECSVLTPKIFFQDLLLDYIRKTRTQKSTWAEINRKDQNLLS